MAGAASSQGNRGVITGINVTPLVDITLVLLIIFMVTAKLIVSHRAMQLDLPKAASGGEVQEILSVALSLDGKTWLNGAVLNDDDSLASRAKAAKAANPELRAIIQADGGVTHRRVMHVLDVIKQAGIAKVAFGVVRDTAATPSTPTEAP